MCNYYLTHPPIWMFLGLYLSINKPPWLINCMCNQNLIIRGEIMVKKTRGAKDCTWHVSFLCWFITSNYVFWIPHLALHFKYKYILTTNWFYIMYIMHSCLLSHIYEQLLNESIIFRVKNTFEPNVLKWVIKIIFISLGILSLLIINVKILSNFQKDTFGRKKRHLK